MKKILILIFFLLIFPIVSAQPSTFTIILEKPSFLRYEIVSFKVNLTQNGNPITNSSTALIARIYNSTGGLVTTVGNIQNVNLYYNSSDNLWYGYWPIPWNPELGEYTLNITANVSGTIYTNSTIFNISMRKPKEIIPPGYLAMTAEEVEDVATHSSFQIPGPYNESKSWLNIYRWAKFMGADSVWPTVGYRAGWSGCNRYAPVNMSFPWCSLTYWHFREYCQEANNSGFTCAPWLWPYNVAPADLAKQNFGIEYNWSLKYDCSNGQLINVTGEISVTDERAIESTLKLIEILKTNDKVSTIGFDWEPEGSVDLRLVNDEFVRKMNINVPSDWDNYSVEEKMKWVGKRITSGCGEYNSTLKEIWDRWMAYNYARSLKRIVDESNFSGSFFMFTWSSYLGRSNGHDPFVFNDAGIDIIAPMTYYSPSGISQNKRCWYENAVIDPWGKELTFEKLPNVVPGQIVQDYAYQNCSYQRYRNPPAPVDMYNRMMYSGEKMYKDGTIPGIFWHDIWRAMGVTWRSGFTSPYSGVEYAIAGGAAASDLRVKAGRIPINLSIETPDEIYYLDTFTGNITVTNLGSNSLPVNVYLLNNTPGWQFISAPNAIINLAPSETKKISFTVKSNLRNYNVDNRFMIAAKADFGNEPWKTHLEFKYVHVKPKSIFSGKLKDKNDRPVEALIKIYEKGTDNLISFNRTDSQGNYYFFIPSGIYDIEFNLTQLSIKLKNMDLSYDLSEPISYLVKEENRIILGINTNKSNFNPQFVEVLFMGRNPKQVTKNGTALEKVYSLEEVKSNKWFYNSSEQKIYLATDRFLIGFAPLFGNPEAGNQGTAYNPYIYTAGPYDVNQTLTVSSIYLYVFTAGKAKVAIYDAIYNPNQYLTKHNPNNLIIQSGEQECKAGEWCIFDIPDTQLQPGKYFLAIKINTSGMLTAIPRGGFGQWRTHNYADPFPNPFGSVPDATGAEYSIYACCS
ncbi:MAG: hypothetical protein QW321_01985 [Candidatus Aenigmatarchaeota archaeon]